MRDAVHIVVQGVTSNSIREKVLTIPGIKFSGINEIILFCDYSGFEIPIGQIFNYVSPIGVKGAPVPTKIKLLFVTQQFFELYDLIPMGHKTICGFEYEKKDKHLFNSIPVLDAWGYNDEGIILSTTKGITQG